MVPLVAMGIKATDQCAAPSTGRVAAAKQRRIEARASRVVSIRCHSERREEAGP